MLATKDRHCRDEATRAGRKADLKMKGVILDAIVAVGERNGCLKYNCRCNDAGLFEQGFDLAET